MPRASVALLTFAFLVAALPAVAQTGRVLGSVTDPTGKAVKGATIKAVNKDALLSDITSTTDDKGRFAMIGLKAGVWTFTAEAPGFEPAVGTAPVRAASLGAPLRFVIQRTPQPIPGALSKDIVDQVSAADALRAQGRYEQAINAYQAIQAKNPKVTTLNVVLADVLRQQAERERDQSLRQSLYTRAIQSYSEAVKDEGASGRVRLDLGLTLVSAGRIDEGVRALQALVAATPDAAAARDAAAKLAELNR
jgi:tetratricopeptide (TPR) repeat protein